MVSRVSRLPRSALSAWVAAAAVTAFPTWELWRERLSLEEYAQLHGETTQIYGYVCQFSSGSTLSPLAPLRGDLEAVMEITTGWAVPALVVLLGFLACLVRGDPATVGRRVAGLLVLNAAVGPLASLHSERGMCRETIPLFSAGWFGAVADAWGITQLCLLVTAALVFAASRAVRPITGDEPAASQAGMMWRRPIAILADYLIVATVLSAVAGTAGYLIGVGFAPRMGAGLLERAGDHVPPNRVRPGEVAVLAGLFLHDRLLGATVVGRGHVEPRPVRPAGGQGVVRDTGG